MHLSRQAITSYVTTLHTYTTLSLLYAFPLHLRTQKYIRWIYMYSVYTTCYRWIYVYMYNYECLYVYVRGGLVNGFSSASSVPKIYTQTKIFVRSHHRSNVLRSLEYYTHTHTYTYILPVPPLARSLSTPYYGESQSIPSLSLYLPPFHYLI